MLIGKIIAMTDNRPEFLRMIDDSKGEFNIVLVHKLDRFARIDRIVLAIEWN